MAAKGVGLGRKVACVDCHFFVKTSCVSPAARPTFVVSEPERALARKGDFSWVRDIDALSCHRGAWDEGRGSDPTGRFETATSPRRKASCFFTPFRPGLSLPAAADLSQREAEAVEAKAKHAPGLDRSCRRRLRCGSRVPDGRRRSALVAVLMWAQAPPSNKRLNLTPAFGGCRLCAPRWADSA